MSCVFYPWIGSHETDKSSNLSLLVPSNFAFEVLCATFVLFILGEMTIIMFGEAVDTISSGHLC